MSSNQERTNLLESLKLLYFKIMGRQAESSAKSGHSHSNMASTQNIESALSEYIDKLATNASNNPVDAPSLELPAEGNRSHEDAPAGQESSSEVEPGGLAEHMKYLHTYSVGSLGAGEKLMQSTWEHFHTSIRLAHQGDVKAAKLHAGLTRNALVEAAKYLSEPVYSQFSQEVLKALEAVQKAREGKSDQEIIKGATPSA